MYFPKFGFNISIKVVLTLFSAKMRRIIELISAKVHLCLDRGFLGFKDFADFREGRWV
jgi:hypothetical protein